MGRPGRQERVPGWSIASSEHSHLRRRSQRWIFRPDRQEAHAVAKLLCHPAAPRLELCPCPLKAMVTVTEFPGRQGLELDVVLHVGRGQHHGRRPGELEQHALECREAWWIEMFHDFD